MENHYQKNNKIKLRNPTNSGFDSHEFIKLALVLLLRKKHKNASIYTEEKIELDIADIYIKIKHDEYVFEIQKDFNKKWQRKTEEKYLERGITPIVIPLKNVISEWENRLLNNWRLSKQLNILDELHKMFQ